MDRFSPQDVCEDFLGGPAVRTSLSNAGGGGLIPGQRTNVPHVVGAAKNLKKKKKKMCVKDHSSSKSSNKQSEPISAVKARCVIKPCMARDGVCL